MELFDSNNSFPIKDGYGMNTLAFVVNTHIEEGVEVSSIEKLKCFMEAFDGGYKKTFYFDQQLSGEDKREVVLLTLKPGAAVLNGGEYVDGRLNLGKNPSQILYSSALRIAGDEPQYKEFKYAPNFKRPIIIIDPEIGDEVKPVLYFDTEANDVRAKIKLLPNKDYIALEARKE